MGGTPPAPRPRRRVTAALIVYGLIVASVAAFVLSSNSPDGSDWPQLGFRLSEMEATFQAVSNGAPPLIAETGTDPPYRLAGQSDDQGMYVVVPQIADLLGLDDPQSGIKYLYVGLFFLTFALYPLVFHRITRSVVAAALAPLLLLAGLSGLDYLVNGGMSIVPADLYWIQTWTAVSLLPLLLLLALRRDWGSWGVPLLVVVALVAGVISQVRLNAGLAILVAGVIVALAHREWSLPRRGIAAAIFAAIYLAVIPLGMELVRDNARDWATERGGLGEEISESHPFWHSVYIGSGYLPNDELIIYQDEVGFTRAEEAEPGVTPLSAEYERVLRDLYLDDVREDLGAAVEGWAKKLVVLLWQPSWLLALAAVSLLAATCITKLRGAVGWGLLLSLPTLAIGAATGLLVIPDRLYTLAWTGGLLFLAVLGLSVLAAGLAEWSTSRGEWLRRGRDGLAALPGRVGRERALAAALALAAVGVLGAAAGERYGPRTYDEYQRWLLDSSGAADLAARKAFARSAEEFAAQSSVEVGVPGPGHGLARAARFDGASGHALGSLDPFAPGAALTVEGWARRTAPGARGALFGSSGAPTHSILRITEDAGNVEFLPAGVAPAAWPGAWPEDDRWVHWALVVDPGSSAVDLVIDGVSQGEMPMPESFDDAYGDLVVGAYAFNNRDPFPGEMSGVALYPSALPAEELARHARSDDYPKAVMANDPALFWRLDERRGPQIRDASGSGNEGVYSWAQP